MFFKPGIIKRNDLESINYLKCYGANCYRGKIGKLSAKYKLEWVNRNIDDILNYDRGILVDKAKDKWLFLSFCMEFIRFYYFQKKMRI